jgi:hypothetical protein
MTVWVEFAGWFQCRLATDPDPSDETRGVSGYVRAVAGEPDLDRIIRLQPRAATSRSHCPEIGVRVTSVFGDTRGAERHPLRGAKVELLDSPKFEGRNHILADDGVEAIVPFHLRIEKDRFSLQRRFDDSMGFPPFSEADRGKFARLQATGINISPGAIGAATGIFDLAAVWKDRSAKLATDLERSTNEIERAALASRIRSMANPRNGRFFAARMLYSIPLQGTAIISDPDGFLPGSPVTGADAPWPADFWCGAWDPDALCGYMVGYVGIAIQDVGISPGLAAMMIDPAQERR